MRLYALPRTSLSWHDQVKETHAMRLYPGGHFPLPLIFSQQRPLLCYLYPLQYRLWPGYTVV